MMVISPAQLPSYRNRLLSAAFFLLLVCDTAVAQASALQLFSDSRPAMGTKFSIYLYASDRERASADFEAAFEEIERVEQALSNYRESSELSRINLLGDEQNVTTDPEVFRLLQMSMEYSRRSQGAFDITVGPLMRAWGFFRANGHFPSHAELVAAKAKIGWYKARLDPQQRTVAFATPGMELDMGAIGKGYAVDQVITTLREGGVTAALVDAGSSTFYALGAPPGKSGWKVIVPRTDDRSRFISEVLLRDNSLSTSGNYEKFFRLNGKTYCHIMDPRTGYPVQGTLQTTVIAPTATDSDALSTTMFVMGPHAGRQLLESFSGTGAIWIMEGEHHVQIEQWRWSGQLCQQDNGCAIERRDNNKR